MFTKEISVPEGIRIAIDGSNITVAKGKTQLVRELWHPLITIAQRDNLVEVATNSSRKNIRALAGTFASHVKNMVDGVSKGFEYRMKIVYSHFPIQLKVEGGYLVIENFLGERAPRRAKIMDGVSVKIAGTDVIVAGAGKEAVGQTTGSIEQATRIKRRDHRVFQDGIYVVSKSMGESS